jgi:hypothetical protein
MEADGLLLGIERDRELLGSGRAEVVARAADRDHERVVGDGAGWRDLMAFSVMACGGMDLALGPVEADHLADAVAEVVIGRLGEVVDRITANIHCPGRDFMQVRLPDVSASTFDEGDLSLSAPA